MPRFGRHNRDTHSWAQENSRTKDKTKILSNHRTNKRKEVEISNIKVEILPAWESAKYLGQKNTFQQQETAEIKNRIRAAWASFYRYKQELTSTSYFLKPRLRLFNMVITPTLSYASGTWALSREHEKCYDRLNGKCIASSSRQREKKRKRRPARKRKMEKMKKQTTEAQMMKLLRVAVQTQIATQTVTSPS